MKNKFLIFATLAVFVFSAGVILAKGGSFRKHSLATQCFYKDPLTLEYGPGAVNGSVCPGGPDECGFCFNDENAVYDNFDAALARYQQDNGATPDGQEILDQPGNVPTGIIPFHRDDNQ